MTIMTRIDVLNKIRADLEWRGPSGKPRLGHIVLEREDAEVLLAETEADAILVVITYLARRLGELMPADERPPGPASAPQMIEPPAVVSDEDLV
jgi:hypothetical protein